MSRLSVIHRLAAATMVAMAPGAIVAEDTAPSVIEIGTRRELFVDDYLLDKLTGVSLRLEQPREEEVALRFEKPWEGWHSAVFATVFRDGPKYRMYYRGLPSFDESADSDNTEVTCYAESKDGIHWTKPELGLVEIDGSTANNVIIPTNAQRHAHNFTPFLDTRPDCPKDERYKALAGWPRLAAFVSADGLRWKVVKEQAVTKGNFDSQNVAFWSETEGCYVAYVRGEYDQGYRSIARSTSPDFRAW